ncbi:hypothetical protein Ae201684P_007150 [Aphanomyces euteiches]|nr:hypothetical protein Ae201684P_007150 [Aphanomyces euteiches]
MEVQKSKLEGGPLEWKLAVDEYDLKIYKADAAHGRPLHCGVKEIVGSLDDLMALYKTQTTAEAKAHAQRFGRGLADAVNVYSILIGTPEYPHNAIHIKWIALKSAFDGIVSKRDCYSDLEMPIDGKRGWVRAITSLELDSRLGGAFCVKRNLGHFGRNRTATNVVFCRKCNRVWDVRVNNIATKAKACNSCSIQGMPIGPVQQVKKLQIVDEDGDLVENESTLYGGASTAVESSEYSDDQSGYSESLAPSSVVFMPPGVLVVE